jgi:hypothetical protein
VGNSNLKLNIFRANKQGNGSFDVIQNSGKGVETSGLEVGRI